MGNNSVSRYYICSVDVAQKHLVGYSYRPVHSSRVWKVLYPGWIEDRDISYAMSNGWYNVILLRDLDEGTCLMLTLQDPLFNEVLRENMVEDLSKSMMLPWDLLT